MKIAFPMITQTELAIDFVHAQYIGILDLENNHFNLLSSNGIDRQFGVISFFDALMEAGLQSVVSPYYSFLALRVFRESNIRPYKAQGVDLNKNILLYKARLLKLFDNLDALQTNQCSRECHHCPTTCS